MKKEFYSSPITTSFDSSSGLSFPAGNVFSGVHRSAQSLF
jgi:hypothetical protein